MRPQDLTDDLNSFLMQQRVAGRKVMVFIDDAQTLPVEVLEQVRLISNLETTRDKLIQIVLVGEPGLLELLDSRELRQMGQRVSVCYEIGAAHARKRPKSTSASRMGHHAEGLRCPGVHPEAVAVICRHTHGQPQAHQPGVRRSLGAGPSAGSAATVGREIAEAAMRRFEPARRTSPSEPVPAFGSRGRSRDDPYGRFQQPSHLAQCRTAPQTACPPGGDAAPAAPPEPPQPAPSRALVRAPKWLGPTSIRRRSRRAVGPTARSGPPPDDPLRAGGRLPAGRERAPIRVAPHGERGVGVHPAAR